MTEMKDVNVQIESPEEAASLFGASDSHINLIEEELNVQITSRGESIKVTGESEDVSCAEEVLETLIHMIRKGIAIGNREVVYCLQLQKKGSLEDLPDLYEKVLFRNAKGKQVRIKTIGQLDYIKAINKNDLIFAIGPAGTGKTYLAVVMAVVALKENRVKKIILTRPAVEAGESLGFLPGDLKEKVDPYLRPLYDALHDLLGMEQTEKLIERGIIEIAPLAYMRGRTLDEAFVILDESQNTTPSQMKMFITRLGFGSKMIITGDKTQIDLPRGTQSGLTIAEKIICDVRGIQFIYLNETDVVRHPLVSRIIAAYDKYNLKNQEGGRLY